MTVLTTQGVAICTTTAPTCGSTVSGTGAGATAIAGFDAGAIVCACFASWSRIASSDAPFFMRWNTVSAIETPSIIARLKLVSASLTVDCSASGRKSLVSMYAG